MSADSLAYDTSFEREVTLSDGSTAILRMVRPSDKELLRSGFDSLSPESRFSRFFTAKLELTNRELRYLTEVDGMNHFAIGALTRDDMGRERGLGIGRFIRDEDDPTVAEPALAVVDDAQGKGLGTVLLRHLTAAARERGIRQFHCELLAENRPMAHLLEEINPRLELVDAGNGVLDAVIPFPEAGPDDAAESLRDTPMHRLLGQVARRSVSVPLGRRLLKYLKRDNEEEDEVD